MPVFFYVDPDILDDERLSEVNSLTLSYTFFRAKEQYDHD
jgi:cytochrome c oxidase assembly protein subunit 11